MRVTLCANCFMTIQNCICKLKMNTSIKCDPPLQFETPVWGDNRNLAKQVKDLQSQAKWVRES